MAFVRYCVIISIKGGVKMLYIHFKFWKKSMMMGELLVMFLMDQ